MSRVPVLGVGIDPLGLEDLLDRAATFIDERRRVTLSYANVHVLNTAWDDPELRAFLGACDVVFCDGNGVRLGARLLGHALPHRMTGADWIWELAARAEGRWRLYWIGGESGVTDRAAAALRARHPGLEIASDHGFHPRSGPEDEACLARVEAFRPDIVLVGMGTPEQERWVAARRDRLSAPVVWCVGATADFVSGKVRRGPRWLTDRAEWLDRLWSEPDRLWHRYLVGNARFLGRVLRERQRRSTASL